MCIMGIMWGHPLYPRTAGQILTCIMTSRSTSLEPNQTPTCIMSSHSTNLELKSWLTINLDLGWECQSLPSEAKKGERRKISNQRESKKRKKNSRSRIGRKRNIQKGLWTRQYLNSKERKPRPKVALSLWLPTKNLCVSYLFASH